MSALEIILFIFLQFERLAKKAAVSHREKVEKFNQQMSELTEFNDIPKVSWTK